MEEDDAKIEDPRLVEAKIQYYKAQAAHLVEQTRKEGFIANQHELAAKEGARMYEEQITMNIQNRFYDFVGIVDARSTEQAMQILSRWQRQSAAPITVRISSPGGSILEGLAFYDFLLGLRQGGLEIRTVALGMAASMAAVLLQAGSTRVVGPNARLLIHELASEQSGALKLSEMQDNADFFKILNENLYGILAERSIMNAKEISRAATRKDWWLTSKEILEKGFADEIGYR